LLPVLLLLIASRAGFVATNRDIGRGWKMPDILVTTRDSIGVISLNRPQVRNVVTLRMWPSA
jgi:hypothetical protein